MIDEHILLGLAVVAWLRERGRALRVSAELKRLAEEYEAHRVGSAQAFETLKKAADDAIELVKKTKQEIADERCRQIAIATCSMCYRKIVAGEAWRGLRDSKTGLIHGHACEACSRSFAKLLTEKKDEHRHE